MEQKNTFHCHLLYVNCLHVIVHLLRANIKFIVNLEKGKGLWRYLLKKQLESIQFYEISLGVHMLQ